MHASPSSRDISARDPSASDPSDGDLRAGDVRARILRARDLRARLLRPANAVEDHGIDLKRNTPAPPRPIRSVWVSLGARRGMPRWSAEAGMPRWSAELDAFNEILRARFAVPSWDAAGVSGWHVKKAVARRFGLTRAEIEGASRTTRHALARQIAIYICVRFCGLSTTRAGRLFGRDHTTALHAVRVVAARAAADPALAAKIAELLVAAQSVAARALSPRDAEGA